jgi:hypothetical protein
MGTAPAPSPISDLFKVRCLLNNLGRQKRYFSILKSLEFTLVC